MHNASIQHYDHAVSAPHVSDRDNRVTLILRFVEKSDIDKLMASLKVSSNGVVMVEVVVVVGEGGGRVARS